MTNETKLLLTAEEAAVLLGVCKSMFWRLHSQGKVPLPVRLSARVVRWRADELRSWIAAGCPHVTEWEKQSSHT